jgi:hypothetical protein
MRVSAPVIRAAIAVEKVLADFSFDHRRSLSAGA